MYWQAISNEQRPQVFYRLSRTGKERIVMDDLVAVGTAGLLGLLLTVLLLVSAAGCIMVSVWNAYTRGAWQEIIQIFFILGIIITIYYGTGLWLRKTGYI
jgi:hypothetical protein